MKPVLTKNKCKWLHMLKSYISQIHYLHIIYYGFPCLHTHYTWCPFIKGILHFYNRNAWSQDVDICFFLSFSIRTSQAFVIDQFIRHLTHVHIYFCIIRKYCHNHKDNGGVRWSKSGLLMPDFIEKISKEIPWKFSCPEMFTISIEALFWIANYKLYM